MFDDLMPSLLSKREPYSLSMLSAVFSLILYVSYFLYSLSVFNYFASISCESLGFGTSVYICSTLVPILRSAANDYFIIF